MRAGTRSRIPRRALSPAVLLLLASALALTVPGWAGTAAKTRRVSVSSTGVEGSGNSLGPSVSADGRFVAFVSEASNLVGNDTNTLRDVFVRDRRTGKTRRVSVSSVGVEANGSSFSPSISADGRFVAFYSNASNLIANDGNTFLDVFVRDRRTGKTGRVSVSSAGTEGDGGSLSPSVSADGRFVAFVSNASNLVRRDSNNAADVFVRDRRTGKTRRVSVSSAGVEANGSSFSPSVSADGRFIAFYSSASNLIANDSNSFLDVFIRDRRTGKTGRASVSSAGTEGDGDSSGPSISADGRFVAFVSNASNLVRRDSNNAADVFVRDRGTGMTRRASVSSASAEANGRSSGSSISADGRFVVFQSLAPNLVGNDTNNATDVFVRGPLHRLPRPQTLR